MANSKGDGNNNGWQQQDRDGGSDGRQGLQQQWPTVMATTLGYSNVDSNGNGDGNRDVNGDHNDNNHGKGNNDEGRVASSCAGNV